MALAEVILYRDPALTTNIDVAGSVIRRWGNARLQKPCFVLKHAALFNSEFQLNSIRQIKRGGDLIVVLTQKIWRRTEGFV